MTLRIRITELMKAKGYASAYELANALHGRMGERTVYRLVEADGRVKNFSADTLEALADVFDVSIAELLIREKKSGSRKRD